MHLSAAVGVSGAAQMDLGWGAKILSSASMDSGPGARDPAQLTRTSVRVLVPKRKISGTSVDT